jgi:UDP-N-acetylglucosamine 2-epimerase (non-hydrolysing)
LGLARPSTLGNGRPQSVLPAARVPGQPRRALVVFGTRPEAIKLAPLILMLETSAFFRPLTVVTGQHRRMLDDVLDLFAIRPDFDLDIIDQRQTLTSVTARSLSGIAPILEAERPDLVIVQGDTATTFAGALAAYHAGIPVAHLEAGLRTHDRREPFPEEMNRRLTTQLTDVHLAPTQSSKTNLVAEGVDPSRIFVTGNTIIDALRRAKELAVDYGDSALVDLDQDPRRVLLVTAHRRESWGTRLRAVGRAIARIARSTPDLLVVLPVHRNPRVRAAVVPAIEGLSNVLIVEPLPYGAFVRLMNRAHLILTDSGGIQEEAPALGKPVLVLREATERPEVLTSGVARLVGTNPDEIVRVVLTLLEDDRTRERMAVPVSPYGDGHASARIMATLAYLAGAGPRPNDFSPSEHIEVAPEREPLAPTAQCGAPET